MLQPVSDNHYAGVWHLQESGTGAAPIQADWNVWNTIGAWPYPPSYCFGWTTRADYAVVAVDLSIDSDNNDGYGAPDHSDQEEYLQDNPYGLGKIIIPNWGDTGLPGVLDCWDGYHVGLVDLNHDNPNYSANFFPMTVTFPAGLDPSMATVSFNYDMAGALPIPADTAAYPWDNGPGTIRIWTKNGNQARNGGFVTDNPQTCGDLVPSGYTLKASDFGYSGLALTVTLYVEGVTEADYIHTYAGVLDHDRPTQSITLKFYPTGNPADMTLTDTVQYIVADAGWAASAGSPAVPASFYWDLQMHEDSARPWRVKGFTHARTC